MIRLSLRYVLPSFAAVLAVAVVAAGPSQSQESTTLGSLAQQTHFHGLAVDPKDPSRLYLATHHGFYAVAQDGTARRVSDNRHDYMGFTPHPADAATLYASGHPESGGNLGFIVSRDGGRTWRQLSPGADGPVDFHNMDVSKADPNTIYGVHGELQVSRDAGRSWAKVGRPPEGLIDLAASAKDASTVYAATKSGLMRSQDGGRSWQLAYLVKRPVSMVETTAKGDVYAFVVGIGLVATTEPSLSWRTISNNFGDTYFLQFAVDPSNAQKLYGVTNHHKLLASSDGGKSWAPLGRD